MKVCDAVVIGSGINSLVAAALLSQRGWEVAVLERSTVLGGAIRTTELTLPGFRHEMFSSFHPQFVGGEPYQELRPALEKLGLRYLNTDVPTAITAHDGEAAVLSGSLAATVAELDRLHSGDGSAFAASLEQLTRQERIIQTLMGVEISSAAGLSRVVRSGAALKMSGLARLGQDALEPAPGLAGSHVPVPASQCAAGAMGLACRARTGRRRLRADHSTHHCGHRQRRLPHSSRGRNGVGQRARRADHRRGWHSHRWGRCRSDPG